MHPMCSGNSTQQKICSGIFQMKEHTCRFFNLQISRKTLLRVRFLGFNWEIYRTDIWLYMFHWMLVMILHRYLPGGFLTCNFLEKTAKHCEMEICKHFTRLMLRINLQHFVLKAKIHLQHTVILFKPILKQLKN